MKDRRFICLIIALILFLLSAAGVESWGVGSIHIHNGWGGLLFFALFFWPRQ